MCLYDTWFNKLQFLVFIAFFESVPTFMETGFVYYITVAFCLQFEMVKDANVHLVFT